MLTLTIEILFLIFLVNQKMDDLLLKQVQMEEKENEGKVLFASAGYSVKED